MLSPSYQKNHKKQYVSISLLKHTDVRVYVSKYIYTYMYISVCGWGVCVEGPLSVKGFKSTKSDGIPERANKLNWERERLLLSIHVNNSKVINTFTEHRIDIFSHCIACLFRYKEIWFLWFQKIYHYLTKSCRYHVSSKLNLHWLLDYILFCFSDSDHPKSRKRERSEEVCETCLTHKGSSVLSTTAELVFSMCFVMCVLQVCDFRDQVVKHQILSRCSSEPIQLTYQSTPGRYQKEDNTHEDDETNTDHHTDTHTSDEGQTQDRGDGRTPARKKEVCIQSQGKERQGENLTKTGRDGQKESCRCGDSGERRGEHRHIKVRYVVSSEPQTLYKDVRHDSSPSVKPKCVDRHLVVVCSAGRKACLLCVGRWCPNEKVKYTS